MSTDTHVAGADRTVAAPAAHTTVNAHLNVNVVLIPLMLGALAYGVLGSAIAPALPFFARTLHTDVTGSSWLLTAYFLTAAGATAILGRLGDMFGKRRILLVTLGALAIGTLVSAVSSSLALELVGRALQGSAAGLFPLAFGIIRDEFPRERVGYGIQALTATISLGTIGLLLPGLIIGHLSWRWLFWIPMILTVLAMAGTWRWIPESPVRPGGTVNWVNAVLMMSGITATVIAISEGQHWGWGSGTTLGLLVGGLAVCAVWIAAESRSRTPLINLNLMRLRGVWATNVVAVMIGAAMYATFALYPVFAQQPKAGGFAYGASILQTGLYMLPASVLAAVAGAYAGRVASWFGPVRALIIASLITAAGPAMMAIWHTRPIDMMISNGVLGLGLGLGLAILFTVVVHAVPAQNVGETTGMNTVVRMLGGAVGTQVVTALITSNAHDGLPQWSGFRASFIAVAVFMVLGAAAASVIARRNPQI